jgi:predicted DCC family thiol-disulfide oxidoreductase YuxK
MVPLLVYDGDCSFCTAAAHRIAPHWKTPARAVAWQRLDAGELDRLGLTPDEVRRAAWWIDESGRRSGGHLAIARALIAAEGWRSVCGKALLVPPFRRLAAGLYPLAARWRHRLPGGTPACRL